MSIEKIVAEARRALAGREGDAPTLDRAAPPSAARPSVGNRTAKSNVLPLSPPVRPDVPPPLSSIESVCVADVEARSVEWLWIGRLARGKLTLWGGDPGVGKSQLSFDVAARISQGSEWPDEGRAPKGNVLILSAEDAVDDTIRPRLEAAGADLRRIHVIRAVRDPSRERSFDLQQDLEALRLKVATVGNVAMLIVDPISSYMGDGIDSHRTTDVRQVLEPVSRLAEETRLCILAITHPPKGAQSKAINTFTGSLAYAAAARIASIAIEDPHSDNERRLLLSVKNNLAPPAPGLGYYVQSTIIGVNIVTSRIAWDREPVRLTANEAIRASSGNPKREKENEAAEFLRQQLAGGPMQQKELFELANEWGIAEKTLRRASEKLGVAKGKAGFQGPSMWRLPDTDST